MTAPFDYDGLWEGAMRVWLAATGQAGVDHATADQLVTDYLRTRIEAAFVPNRTVELLGEAMEGLSARAEAAEARVKVMSEALRDVDALIDQDEAARDVIAAVLGGEHEHG